MEHVYDTQAAASMLQRLIADGRNYVQLLQDARRGRHSANIEPAYYSSKRKAYYFGSDLVAFAEREIMRIWRRKTSAPPRQESFEVRGASRWEIIENAQRMH